MQTIRVKIIDKTGDTVLEPMPVNEVNKMIARKGGYLAYDSKTKEQIREVNDTTEEVVLSRAIVAG